MNLTEYLGGRFTAQFPSGTEVRPEETVDVYLNACPLSLISQRVSGTIDTALRLSGPRRVLTKGVINEVRITWWTCRGFALQNCVCDAFENLPPLPHIKNPESFVRGPRQSIIGASVFSVVIPLCQVRTTSHRGGSVIRSPRPDMINESR